jgi:hypothetical protein
MPYGKARLDRSAGLTSRSGCRWDMRERVSSRTGGPYLTFDLRWGILCQGKSHPSLKREECEGRTEERGPQKTLSPAHDPDGEDLRAPRLVLREGPASCSYHPSPVPRAIQGVVSPQTAGARRFPTTCRAWAWIVVGHLDFHRVHRYTTPGPMKNGTRRYDLRPEVPTRKDPHQRPGVHNPEGR